MRRWRSPENWSLTGMTWAIGAWRRYVDAKMLTPKVLVTVVNKNQQSSSSSSSAAAATTTTAATETSSIPWMHHDFTWRHFSRSASVNGSWHVIILKRCASVIARKLRGVDGLKVVKTWAVRGHQPYSWG